MLLLWRSRRRQVLRLHRYFGDRIDRLIQRGHRTLHNRTFLIHLAFLMLWIFSRLRGNRAVPWTVCLSLIFLDVSLLNRKNAAAFHRWYEYLATYHPSRISLISCVGHRHAKTKQPTAKTSDTDACIH